MTRELSASEWPAFCQALNTHHQDARISLRSIGSDARPRVIFDDALLQSITFEHADNTCSDLIVIEAGDPDARPASHTIIEPIRIILRHPTIGAAYREMEIVAENGTTLVDFHPAVVPSLQAA
jgi:hypothetical protein